MCSWTIAACTCPFSSQVSESLLQGLRRRAESDGWKKRLEKKRTSETIDPAPRHLSDTRSWANVYPGCLLGHTAWNSLSVEKSRQNGLVWIRRPLRHDAGRVSVRSISPFDSLLIIFVRIFDLWQMLSRILKSDMSEDVFYKSSPQVYIIALCYSLCSIYMVDIPIILI